MPKYLFFLLLGFPVAFALAANGIIFGWIGMAVLRLYAQKDWTESELAGAILVVSVISTRHMIKVIRKRDDEKDRLDRQLMHASKLASVGELAERAKAGRSRPADITGATFTISNLGMYGVDAFTAIITPPQAAILAVSSIVDRVVPVDGAPGIRPIMSMTLSCDHRVFDGARAALFLSDLAEAIARPGSAGCKCSAP